jgi:tRNA G10  N-methylase Trm11
MGWYLCYFMHRHLDFRRAEFQALADLNGFGDAVEWRAPFGGVEHSPFHYVRLPSDDAARAIMKRSILTKGIVELWGEGNDQDELNAAIAAFDAETKARYTAEGSTFKVELEDFGKTLHGTRDDNWGPAVRRIDALKPAVEFNGRARMKGAEHLFWSIESAEGNDLRGIPSDIPSRHYFGRVVAASAARAAINTYDLKKRRYLGPTSMDVEMSLIMANMVHAGPGRVVWDPFCGTGSVLIAAAHFGAMTMGSDIDVRRVVLTLTGSHTTPFALCARRSLRTFFLSRRLSPPALRFRSRHTSTPFNSASDAFELHPDIIASYGPSTLIRVIRWGKKDKRTGEHVDVWTNFKDYSLPPPIALLRADLHKPPFRGAAASGAASERGACEGHLQGVVGDPPYGVRAGGRKSGGRKRLPDGTARAVPEHHRENHIPSTVPYPFHECMDDLMEQAARLLSVGGRLSFFVPGETGPNTTPFAM